MSPALLFHIGAGLIALVAGAIAVTVTKGSRAHRQAGIVFAIAMLSMGVMAGYLSVTMSDRSNLPGALFTCYLVATGWGAMRRRQRAIGAFEIWALLAGLVLIALTIALALIGQANPDRLLDGKPAGTLLVFAAFEVFAILLDMKVIAQRRLLPTQRTARHIWRMCAALFFATGSFFLGQQKVMPDSIQGSPLLVVLALAPLPLMMFWLWRNRLTSRRKLAAAG
jgi:hypothetical protein